ncbi:hypothetical protein [Microcoleus sp. D3_18a_C4]|uniref:hypothetical protein n=1 Tax=Microcoleus sp. D3_18a_C4 TaxID=3055332 RepID=UPI002FD14D1F
MPVPQPNSSLVEQASCLFLTMVQDDCTILNYLFRNRQDACSTTKFISCGTGILPVLENGARCE